MNDQNVDDTKRLLHFLLYLGASVFCLFIFYSVGDTYLSGFGFFLGSIDFPGQRHVAFLSFWTIFGSLSALFLALALARGFGDERTVRSVTVLWRRPSARMWLLLSVLLGAAIPMAIRYFILEGAPLTMDEGAYRFQARLLAEGRLAGTALPDPLRIFADRKFLINEGTRYSQYFLGWPALMVPGVYIGLAGSMNAVYSACAAAGVFMVVRELYGRVWASVAVVLYLTAPFLMIAAATELAHTSCFAALVWALWFFLQTQEEDAPWWTHAGFSLLFAVAFFVRPSSSLGVGLPFLIAWAVSAWRRKRGVTLLAAFATPALLLAGLFLYVNHVQNGSIFTVAYHESLAYMRSNPWYSDFWDHYRLFYIDLTDPRDALASTGVALYRLNYALFGWPSSLVLLLIAGLGTKTRLWWASFLCYMAVHFYTHDIGIDTFGPMHFFEVSLPVIVLTVAGLRNLYLFSKHVSVSRQGSDLLPQAYRSLPVMGFAAVIVVSFAGYVPPRVAAIREIAELVNKPERAVEQSGLDEAVIFAPRPYLPPYCEVGSVNLFDFWPPYNDLELKNSVLWMNHLSVSDDRRFMDYFPKRDGYILQYTDDCDIRFHPLEGVRPGEISPVERPKPDWSTAPSPSAFSPR